jgi:competence protein ComEA
MLDLTPGERRGALVVLALCALGTLWDLAHVRPEPAPPVPDAAPSAAPVAATAMPAPAAGPRRKSPPPSSPVDLACANAAELDALPGIGPVLAARIVEHRRLHGAFRTVDELLAVRGVGPRLLERLRPYVVAGASRTMPDSMRAERNAAKAASVQFGVQVRTHAHR